MACPVQNVSSHVLLHALSGCLEDHADHANDEGESEAFDSAPEIKNLGQGQGRTSTDGGGHDAADVHESVGVERGCDVRVESVVQGVLDNVDEGDEPQAEGSLVFRALHGRGQQHRTYSANMDHIDFLDQTVVMARTRRTPSCHSLPSDSKPSSFWELPLTLRTFSWPCSFLLRVLSA